MSLLFIRKINLKEGEPQDQYNDWVAEVGGIVDGNGDYNFAVDNAVALAKIEGKNNIKYYCIHPKNWMFA